MAQVPISADEYPKVTNLEDILKDVRIETRLSKEKQLPYDQIVIELEINGKPYQIRNFLTSGQKQILAFALDN